AKKAGKSDVAVAFADGVGNPALKPWQAALRTAAEKNLPLLVVWRTREADQHSAPTPASSALPHIPVDGDDAVAVCRGATECLAQARKGHGPSLVECHFFLDTTGALANMETYLQRKGLFDPRLRARLKAAFRRVLKTVPTVAIE
ncbi:MAG: thiamine pyrophosphate-dependent enzyme, partial [Terracidiphilus sp.]